MQLIRPPAQWRRLQTTIGGPLKDDILKVYVSGQEVTWNATLTIVSDTAEVQWVRRDKGTFSYVRPGTTTFRVGYQGASTERTITLP